MTVQQHINRHRQHMRLHTSVRPPYVLLRYLTALRGCQKPMKLYQFARQLHTNLKYVPRCELAQSNEVEQLQSFVRNAKKLLVITGAGTSTESGIPDYRSEGVGMYARTSVRPIQYQEFIRSADVRRSYWARNFIGWPYFESAQPNEAHLALSEWERKGKLHWLVTQNIDLLHQKAGSKRLTTLHGSSSGVVCLSCRSITDRWSFQEVLRQHNPEWHAQPILVSADSDAILTEEQVKGFQVPSCEKCSGVLMPNITFFGENVAKHIVDSVFNLVETCDSLLVVGSSLQVYSGYRFIEKAAALKKNTALLNIGSTRADHLSQIKVNARCAQILPLIKVC